MDHLHGFEGKFGAIVMMDVAEHLEDPATVFRHLKQFLAPAGILIVLTGNADYWMARWSLPRYWYMSFPIHLVHLGSRYFRWFGGSDGWRVVCRMTFRHQDHGLRQWIRELQIGLRVLLLKQLERTGAGQALAKTRLFRGIAAMRSPPLLFCLRDHIAVVLAPRRCTSSRLSA